MASKKLSDEETPTRPEGLSRSQEFHFRAQLPRIEFDVRNGAPVSAADGALLLTELASRTALCKLVLGCVPRCSKCSEPAVKLHGAAGWCDLHAAEGSIDLPFANALRRAARL